ncbi:hypothetical protein HM1_0753 [Heliomicrobium modesticaldum Ice1]|uniref:Uncharacterized protein n=1 Tax=Heliobacterium modesticaldum (strain ATCC 51547 / Ice1) TaxID=498761 RepID=B0TB75_HELMI|nr:hypothetical protein HM1_0753 [Heliomicrobium modesticaldum Ice1]
MGTSSRKIFDEMGLPRQKNLPWIEVSLYREKEGRYGICSIFFKRKVDCSWNEWYH